ncbi:MAG: PKD domain-containing protein, partial [Bacteroidota bacterium]
MKLYRNFFFILLGAFITTGSYAQFNLAGNAISTGGGCYTLTNSTGQSGAIWNTTQISLNQAFDITLTLNFGCNSTSDDYMLAPNCGGDGISFILQPNNTGVVGSGGQCGFGGITPSLGVVMDDYTNGPDDNATYDGTVDHISLNSNGDVIHGTGNELVAPSVGAGNGFPSELENCNNYTFRFKWTPGSPNGTIQVWFNGALSFTYTGNVIANIFGGNPNVYWGVGGSTGSCWNTQTVCMAIAADFTFTTACSGSATTFTNQSVSSSPITSYLWNFGDGQTSTLQNPTHVYAAPGTYNVTLTITNSAGLTSTISNVVTVIGVTTTATASPASICTGASTTLTGTVTPNPATVNLYPSFTNTTDYAITDGGVAFGWTGTGGTFAQSNIAVSGINAGWSVNSVCLNINHTWDGDVIVYLKDPCGNLVQLISGAGGSGDNFTNTCFTPTAATAITAGTAPFSGSYSPSGGAGIWTTLSGCATPNGTWSLLVGDQTSTDAGTLLDWTITFNNPVTATYTYAWNPGNITTTLTPVVTPAVTTTYTLTATTSLGCTSTSTVVVTVTPGPTITVNSPTICNGATATLTANGGTTYAWSGGLGAGNPKTVTPATTTTYTVTGTTAGCSGTTTSVVTVNPLPTVTTTPATICAGATATISAAGANTYAWSSGGTGASTTVTPAATTTYTVTGTSATGCTKTATCIVTVNPLPTVTTTPATICIGSTATISAAGANTYAWSSG